MKALVFAICLSILPSLANACSRKGPVKFDINRGVKTSLLDSEAWKGSKVISTKRAPAKQRPAVTHILVIYRESDNTCHRLSVYLYGGNGDCHERINIVSDEGLDRHKCGQP